MRSKEGQCLDWRESSSVKIPAESGKSAIFASVKGQRILLVHADRYCRKGRSDGPECFFEQDQKVADYIVSKPGIVDVIVELKGTNILGAIEQIEATIPPWKAHRCFSGKIGALILSSKGGNHPQVSARFLIKQEQFKKQGIKLKHFAAPNMTFEFSSFL